MSEQEKTPNGLEVLMTDENNRYMTYYNPDLITPMTTNTDKLNEEEKSFIQKALDKTWTTPKFKMKYFVAEEQITPFHKLKQMLLELRASEEACEHTDYMSKTLPKKIEILEMKIDRTDDPLEKAELELALIEAKKNWNDTKRLVSQSYVERHMWVDILKEFLETDESKAEDGTPLLDLINTPAEEEYERQYWTARLAKQAAMDMLAYGQITGGNMSAIADLKEEQQNDVLQIATSYTLQMKEHQNTIKENVGLSLGITPPDEKLTLVPPGSHTPPIGDANAQPYQGENSYQNEDFDNSNSGDDIENVYNQ